MPLVQNPFSRHCCPCVLGNAEMQEHFKKTASYFFSHFTREVATLDVCSLSINLWPIFQGIHCQFSYTAILDCFMMSIFLTLLLQWVLTHTHSLGKSKHKTNTELSIKQQTLTECLLGASSLLGQRDSKGVKHGPSSPGACDLSREPAYAHTM